MFYLDPYEAKYQYLIIKKESAGLKYLDNSKALVEYSNHMGDIFKNIEEYNPNKKRKMLIVFGDMIADIFSNKKLNLVLPELILHNLLVLYEKILD